MPLKDTTLEVERLCYPTFNPEEISLDAPEMGINWNLYEDNLRHINRSFRIIEDPHSGKQFEIALSGLEHDPDDTVDCESSTYRSSLSNNVGNAVEFAENAALHPDRTRLYISSLGNGASSYFDKNERIHLRKTGSFIHQKPGKDAEALPTIKALASALESNSFHISRVSANSAGGSLATALSLELPENQLTHIHLKGRPNISERGVIKDMVIGMFVIENLINNPHNAKESKEPWAMSEALQEKAREKIPYIYEENSEIQTALSGLAYIRKLYTDMIAYSHGAASMKKIAVDMGTVVSPALIDTRAMLQRHNKLLPTFHFTKQDRLYKSYKKDDLHKRGDFESFLKLLQFGDDDSNRATEAILHDGTHADHTYYPSHRWAVEKYAFNR